MAIIKHDTRYGVWMTSNTAPSPYKLTGSFSGAFYRAFDENLTNDVTPSDCDDSRPKSIVWQLDQPIRIWAFSIMAKLSSTTGGQVPYNMTVEGSNDGTNFTVVHTLTHADPDLFVQWNGSAYVTDAPVKIEVTDPVAYQYWQFSFGTNSNMSSGSRSGDSSSVKLALISIYQLEESGNSYTVTFADWNGTTLKTEVVTEGGSATAPADPVRVGYAFTGWDTDFSSIQSDLTVTAQYRELATYTVEFQDWDGTVLKTESVLEGADATPPTDPSREGYVFTGWSGSYINVQSNLTVTAQYSELTTHTVTFADWDGTVLKVEAVQTGESATPPPNPTRDGYTFAGWDRSYTNILADITIIAQYTAIPTYTVTFQDWDGTVLKTETVRSGEDATPPADPVRAGYVFTGWDKPCTNITANTVITAQYAAIPTYTVIFQDWDSVMLKTETVMEGGAATAPPDPVRIGYNFIGWDNDFSCVVADMTIHAQYEPEVYYTVEFMDWDGTILKTESVTHGGYATPPASPSRNGYTFLGWLPDTYDNVTADLFIIAQYQRIIVYHTVVFLDWDGGQLSSQQVEEGLSALPPLPPLREGYIFDRWSKDFDAVLTDLSVTAIYRAKFERANIKIYRNNALVQTIDRVLSATLRDSLEGELTFEFSTLADRGENIAVNCVAEFDGCYFNVVRVTKSISSDLMVTAASCEHISYILNDDCYKISAFDFTGTPIEGLTALLSGTQFSAGIVEFSDAVTMKINTEVTRRAALMQYIAILGGEIEYDGSRINIRRHRGSTVVKQLLDSRNVTGVSVTYDSRADTASYEVAFHKMADCEVGDEVQIIFTPLGVDTATRIIAMEYNPFYKYSIRVEVGSYKPTINDSLYRIEQNVADVGKDMATMQEDFDSFSGDYEDFQEDYEHFLSTYKEVQNLNVGESQFTVTFTDGSTAVYNYAVDTSGRIRSITKVVGV